MQSQTPAQQPSPLRIFETLNAYMQTAALKTAIELDLFTHIAHGANTAREIGTRIQASERGIRILCDYLVVHGFLTKNANSYRLTADSGTFLNRDSPAYFGSAIQFLCSPMLTQNYDDLTGAVRKGGSMKAEGTVGPDDPIWVDFARGMAPMMMMPAEMIAKLLSTERGEPWKVLDIAAGHGIYGITIAKQNPNARIVAVDWARVLGVASENAKKWGVAERHRTLPGSAFDVEFGSGYDVVLITNFLHHFDPPTNEKLLKKIHAALKPGGRAVTLEFIPNEDRVTPPESAGFSLIMLASTPAGDAYTFPEFERMLRNAGFSRNELHQLPPTPHRAIVSVK
jgi:ubiquinone/menaquinone biosynthesis C-methylase UbiE